MCALPIKLSASPASVSELVFSITFSFERPSIAQRPGSGLTVNELKTSIFDGVPKQKPPL